MEDIFTQLNHNCALLTILVVPTVTDALINQFPKCEILADSTYSRLRAKQAMYWNIRGIRASDVEWTMSVLLVFNRLKIRYKFNLPNEICYSILGYIMWSDMPI